MVDNPFLWFFFPFLFLVSFLLVYGPTLERCLYRPETGPYNTHSLLVLCLDKIFVDNFVDKALGRFLLLWLYFPVIVCYGISRDHLLGHVIFFVVIFYGCKLQSMDCTCMSTFFPFLFSTLLNGSWFKAWTLMLCSLVFLEAS